MGEGSRERGPPRRSLAFVLQQPSNGANQATPEQRFTRAGAFTINNEGQLVTQAGQLVMSTDNQPIVIPANNTGDITIQGDGAVKTRDDKTVGKIRVVRFENERDLKAVDGTSFRSDNETPIEVPSPKVAQGVLEDSNVNSITEVTKLINVNRAYADVAKLVDEEHKRKQQAADIFTRQVSA